VGERGDAVSSRFELLQNGDKKGCLGGEAASDSLGIQKDPERDCSMPTHLEETLQRDIDENPRELVAMAGLAEQALRDCLKALLENNRQLAYAVILRDQFIDGKEKELDQLCQRFLARQQPVASILRFVYSSIKVNLELERVGDYAESIARQFLKLSQSPVAFPRERFVQIAQLSIPMLHDAIQAFVGQDEALARKTIEIEEAVDVIKSELNRDLVELFRNRRSRSRC
jgi:phosphate transport system protein